MGSKDLDDELVELYLSFEVCVETNEKSLDLFFVVPPVRKAILNLHISYYN